MIDVVGVGADGALAAPELLAEAEVVLGGERHLSLASAQAPNAELVAWPKPLRAGLPALLDAYAGRRIVALASGDPLVAGVGTTLIDLMGPENVRLHPAVSSAALARAEMRWPSDSCAVVRFTGDNPDRWRRQLAPGRRFIILSADEHSPELVAGILLEEGLGDSKLTVLGDLGSDHFSRRDGVADTWGGPAPRLNVVAVECVGATTDRASRASGLPDECYANDGQLTKRHLRATALAMLQPVPGQLLWDLGAGSGSIGIEWARSHPDCSVEAVEQNAERADRARRNARALGVPQVKVHDGRARDVIADLPDPDAIFIGGGADQALIDACWARLKPGGRFVVHGVTVETECLLADCRRRFGGGLFTIQVAHAEPIGRYTGWTTARAVRQWVAVKPSHPTEEH